MELLRNSKVRQYAEGQIAQITVSPSRRIRKPGNSPKSGYVLKHMILSGLDPKALRIARNSPAFEAQVGGAKHHHPGEQEGALIWPRQLMICFLICVRLDDSRNDYVHNKTCECMRLQSLVNEIDMSHIRRYFMSRTYSKALGSRNSTTFTLRKVTKV